MTNVFSMLCEDVFIGLNVTWVEFQKNDKNNALQRNVTFFVWRERILRDAMSFASIRVFPIDLFEL